MPGGNFDNHIPGTAQAFQKLYRDRTVIIVSKGHQPGNLKAAVLGIPAEDYSNDQVSDDVLLLYTGQEERRRDSGPATIKLWSPGKRLAAPFTKSKRALRGHCPGETFPPLGGLSGWPRIPVRPGIIYGASLHATESRISRSICSWTRGSLRGAAGTGRTLLALAADLPHVLDRNLYHESS